MSRLLTLESYSEHLHLGYVWKDSPYIFLQQFHSFGSHVEVFDPSVVGFHVEGVIRI